MRIGHCLVGASINQGHLNLCQFAFYSPQSQQQGLVATRRSASSRRHEALRSACRLGSLQAPSTVIMEPGTYCRNPKPDHKLMPGSILPKDAFVDYSGGLGPPKTTQTSGSKGPRQGCQKPWRAGSLCLGPLQVS